MTNTGKSDQFSYEEWIVLTASRRMGRLELAIYLATAAHSGQIDDDQQPHILHSIAVMLAVKTEYEIRPIEQYSLEDLMIAAILHDVVEDTRVNLYQINNWFGENVAHIVDCVTRRGLGTDETKEFYRDFLYRCKADPGARLIKLKDLSHNMGRTCKIAASKAKWKAKLDYKYSVAWRCIYDDDLSWEQASWEITWEEIDGVSTPHFFIADPNGKRIEISKDEFEQKIQK